MASQPDDDTPGRGAMARWLIPPIWLVWLAASLYLIAWSAYYTFLTIAFTGYSYRSNVQPSSAEYMASAAKGSVPLLVAVALALAAFLFWRKPRFRVLGLLFIALEVALALVFTEDPVAFLGFVRVLT
jgi:hypothetical protein